MHRDLKCENVLLDAYQNVKLADFGFARFMKPGERSKTFCGSRAYLSPEIIRSVNNEHLVLFCLLAPFSRMLPIFALKTL